MLEYNRIVTVLELSAEPANPDVSEGKPPRGTACTPALPTHASTPSERGEQKVGTPEPGLWGPREEVRDPVHPSVGLS